MPLDQNSTKPRKNGDIRGFFKAAATPNSQPSEPPASSGPLSPVLISSPRTPPKSSARSFNHKTEIKGSDEDDEDDSDSDDSLGSITEALGIKPRPAAHQRDKSLLSTPQAKRIASSSNIHRSPLTLQPKRHKFDMKALLKHTQEHDRAEASVREADALIAEIDAKTDAGTDDSGLEDDPRRCEEAAQKVLLAGKDDSKVEKLQNAMRRTQDHGAQKHCYFFTPDEQSTPKNPTKNPFPHKKAVGCWKCLSQAATRRQSFVMRLPRALLRMGNPLPDELLLWMLDEICTEQNAELRTQYIDLASLCEEQTRRLVTDMRLYAMLEKMGGPRYAREHSKFKSTTEIRPEYLERDWSPLTTFLQLVEELASSLDSASVISAVQLLLRMSLDPVVGTIVREAHMKALKALIANLARSRSRWNMACEAICAYVYENIDDLELRIVPILTIPSSTSSLIDLRRRMAAESLFYTPGLGGKPVESFLSYEKLCNRLDEVDFQPRHGSDFEQLRVLTMLLDIVINNADFMRPTTASTTTPSDVQRSSSSTTLKSSSSPSSSPSPRQTKQPPTTTTTMATTINSFKKQKQKQNQQTGATAQEEADRRFNTQVDTLASRIRIIHEKILDKPDRKTVKAALNGLEKRLTYTVRTRPPPKTHINLYEDGFLPKPQNKEDIDVPRQRDFMREWAVKKQEKGKGKGVQFVTLSSEDEGDDMFADAEEFAGNGVQVAVG
ncbi:hypothetical protein F5Y16DRAFT_61025 [Xylariaceae sp. FL0255]|nr:hypothetical protein F5Y16DRAFT_61025 [Xylariaceae sp. FL0255]